MIYLSGYIGKPLLRRAGIGFMYSPGMGNKLAPPPHAWAADAGTFVAQTPAARAAGVWAYPDFDLDEHLDWLGARAHAVDRCLFAVLPDRIGDADETTAWSYHALAEMLSFGYRVAYTVQPGCDPGTIPWHLIGALFLGGDDAWQASPQADAVLREGKARGLWLHRGRVNSYRKLLDSQARGFDSCDGTFCAFGPDQNVPQLLRWLAEVNAQPCLPYCA